MANRAYLYNTDGGDKRVEIAEWARAIPVTWLCAFRPEDLKGKVLEAPLARVLENLRAALPVLEKVVGVPQLARAYHDDTLRAFATLELPRVELDAAEVVDGDYARLLIALDGSEAAIAQLKEWSDYAGDESWDPGQRVPAERHEGGLWCGFGPKTTVPQGDEPGSLDIEARPWMDAAARGDADAQFRIGHLFKQAQESGERDDAAREWLRRAALQDHRDAQFHLGQMTDAPESADWLTRAAKAGHVQAQADLAAHLSIAGESRLAMAWLTRAAENGHGYAAYKLGRIYQGTRPGELDMVTAQYLGPGDHPADLDKSFFWLRKAVDAGHGDSRVWLLLGERRFLDATSEAYTEAARWFRMSADEGNDKAQLWLGVLNYHGLGVKRDHAAAARWTRKSAQQGAPGAQYSLGILYDRGEGVPRDREACRRWMQKASEQGFPLADEYLAWPSWKLWGRPGFPGAVG